MRITDLLKKEGILIKAAPKGRDEAVSELVKLHSKSGNLSDAKAYKVAILKREEHSTTAVGNGIAVPHAKSGAVKRAGLTAMTVPTGVDYNTPDGAPARLFFMIAAPDGENDTHLEVLSRLMALLMDDDFSKKVLLTLPRRTSF